MKNIFYILLLICCSTAVFAQSGRPVSIGDPNGIVTVKGYLHLNHTGVLPPGANLYVGFRDTLDLPFGQWGNPRQPRLAVRSNPLDTNSNPYITIVSDYGHSPIISTIVASHGYKATDSNRNLLIIETHGQSADSTLAKFSSVLSFFTTQKFTPTANGTGFELDLTKDGEIVTKPIMSSRHDLNLCLNETPGTHTICGATSQAAGDSAQLSVYGIGDLYVNRNIRVAGRLDIRSAVTPTGVAAADIRNTLRLYNDTNNLWHIYSYADGIPGNNVTFYHSGGSPLAPGATGSGYTFGQFTYSGYDGSASYTGALQFTSATEAATPTAHGTKTEFRTTPNGSTGNVSNYEANNGRLYLNENGTYPVAVWQNADDASGAALQVNGSTHTSQTSGSGYGVMKFGKALTGSDAAKYWEVNIDGTNYYIKALTALP